MARGGSTRFVDLETTQYCVEDWNLAKAFEGGEGGDPQYSTTVGDHTYGVIYFALGNLCPPKISQMLRGIFCLLDRNTSLFILPKKLHLISSTIFPK